MHAGPGRDPGLARDQRAALTVFRGSRRELGRRVVLPGAALAFLHLAILGALIGQVGGSRAYSVGLHTLFRDHLVPVLIATGAALAAAVLVGRRIAGPAELGLLFLGALAADVVAGLGVIVVFGEIRLIDLGRVVFTETAAATQLVAIGVGVLVGYASRRRPTASEREISARG